MMRAKQSGLKIRLAINVSDTTSTLTDTWLAVDNDIFFVFAVLETYILVKSMCLLKTSKMLD